MYISTKDWLSFVEKLSKINQKAADDVRDYVRREGFADTDALVGYCYQVAQTYGTASASLSALMYDTVTELEGKFYPPAEMAPNPTYGDVAKAVRGTMKTSVNAEEIGGSVGRLVKRTGQDTILFNGIRDGAEFAWIPSGDTCAFCLTLASRGWQKISKNALKNGHAEHIHSNCDCTYMIRHSSDTEVQGYNPQEYKRIYDNADGNTPKQKINAMRRQFYAENKAAGIASINSAIAEEAAVVNGRVIPAFIPAETISDAEKFAAQFTNGGKYSTVNYSDIDINYANEFNRAMNDVLSQYSPKYKLQNIEPMNTRKKEFRGTTSDAAYKWGSNDLFYNKNYFKNSREYQKHRAQADALLDQVLPNVDALIDKYKGESGFLAKKQLNYVEALKISGRPNVGNNPYITMVHELGHYLDDTAFRAEFRNAGFSLSDSFEKFSKGVSAYATESTQEYIAESFAAYWNGEKERLDPKLVDIFERLRK